MNQKGWGLQAMILWCACLGILLIIATISINNSINSLFSGTNNRNSNQPSVIKGENNEEKDIYSSYLNKMVEASKKYIEKEYKNDPENVDYIKLSVNTLVNNNYMDTLINPKNNSKCIGYVSIRYINNTLNYEPFLKCDNDYETEGFVARHAE